MPLDAATAQNLALQKTQIFTPPGVANFMAGLIAPGKAGRVPDILEPGSGAGALAEAVLEGMNTQSRLSLVEKDQTFAVHLQELLVEHPNAERESELHIGDFFEIGLKWKSAGRRFTNIIMNPPYGKIPPGDSSRTTLAQAGIPSHNLFSAFLWIATDLLDEGGRLIAIVPRSFLSGSTFARARDHILSRTQLVALHHFTDRRSIFGRDGVQQEVVIFACERSAVNGSVKYTQSAGLDDMPEPVDVPRRRLVMNVADGRAILVPAMSDVRYSAQPSAASLIPSDVQASIGSVVDFRMGSDLVESPSEGTPLIGSEVFASRPRSPRGLVKNGRTNRHTFAPGRYIVIRRISPSESTPRIQAKVLDLRSDIYVHGVAFENHLIVLHQNRSGLSEDRCKLLIQRLEDPAVERQFNERGGTTQVNLHDLRAIRLQEDGEDNA